MGVIHVIQKPLFCEYDLIPNERKPDLECFGN